jgi:hypothetical protein
MENWKNLQEFRGIRKTNPFTSFTYLHLVFLYCEEKGFPQLNSLVVSQETGFPGEPYPKKMTPIEFLVERAQVFAYGWYTKDKHPRSEDFEALRSATV